VYRAAVVTREHVIQPCVRSLSSADGNDAVIVSFAIGGTARIGAGSVISDSHGLDRLATSVLLHKSVIV
jgi:hypothetical protein